VFFLEKKRKEKTRISIFWAEGSKEGMVRRFCTGIRLGAQVQFDVAEQREKYQFLH